MTPKSGLILKKPWNHDDVAAPPSPHGTLLGTRSSPKGHSEDAVQTKHGTHAFPMKSRALLRLHFGFRRG